MMPNQPPNFSQMVEQQLLQMKKRTSQIKGELNDGITETIADNFKSFYQIAQQLTGQIDQRDKQIVELEKDLEAVYNAHPELKIAAEAKKKTKNETIIESTKKMQKEMK